MEGFNLYHGEPDNPVVRTRELELYTSAVAGDADQYGQFNPSPLFRLLICKMRLNSDNIHRVWGGLEDEKS